MLAVGAGEGEGVGVFGYFFSSYVFLISFLSFSVGDRST